MLALPLKDVSPNIPHTFSFVSMVGLNFKRIACPACINFWTVREEENIIALLLGSGGRRGD